MRTAPADGTVHVAWSAGLVGQWYRHSGRDTVRAGDGAALLMSAAATFGLVSLCSKLTQVLAGSCWWIVPSSTESFWRV